MTELSGSSCGIADPDVSGSEHLENRGWPLEPVLGRSSVPSPGRPELGNRSAASIGGGSSCSSDSPTQRSAP
jgi:hypothetical protein